MNNEELRQDNRALRSKNMKLKEEIENWKKTSRREGIYGILLGGGVFLIIGLMWGITF